MTHLTMLHNVSSYAEGDAIRQWSGSARLYNSIVSGGGSQPDCHGNVSVSRGNFSPDGTCASTEGFDPQLEEMTGTPGYFPPLEGSPLIDAADAEFCLAVDQTGKPRPIGAGCDIGAIESGTVSETQLTATTATEDLSACSVTTTHDLNFRDAPDGNRIGSVPANSTLSALAQTPFWINVEVDGVSGWISAEYVTTSGDCG